MDEIRSNYFEEIKEQKSCIPKHTPKAKFPEPAVPECYNTIVYGKPIRWDSWKSIPDPMKKNYLEDLFGRFGNVSTTAIGTMLGVDRKVVDKEIQRLGIEYGRAKPTCTRKFYKEMNIIPTEKSKQKKSVRKVNTNNTCINTNSSIDIIDASRFKNLKVSYTAENADQIVSLIKRFKINGSVKITIEF